MKYLKLFEDFSSNDISRDLARNVVNNVSSGDRSDVNKSIQVSYTGELSHTTGKFFIKVPNVTNRPYTAKGVPPPPSSFVQVKPTKDFSEDDIDAHERIGKSHDINGRKWWKKPTYKINGYQNISEDPKLGLEELQNTYGVINHVYVTSIDNLGYK